MPLDIDSAVVAVPSGHRRPAADRLLFVAETSNAGDERCTDPLFCPDDSFLLGVGSVEFALGLVFTS